MPCPHHPGRPGVFLLDNQSYCAACRAGIIAARVRVHRHVQPRDCFVWYIGANNWQPIAGTGCAHWVAHQLDIHRGGRGEQCLAGFTYRVRTLVQGMARVALAAVRVDDIYVTPAGDHTGLVVGVVASPLPQRPSQITIRHDSSAQGRVVDNDFAAHFGGVGNFYR